MVNPVDEDLSVRLVVLVTPAMLKSLDNMRWEERLSSRGEAARRLLAEGLSARLERKQGKA
jgi:hypothetical protein